MKKTFVILVVTALLLLFGISCPALLLFGIHLPMWYSAASGFSFGIGFALAFILLLLTRFP